MESPKALFDRIENDITNIEKMYEAAARMYPYENVHGARR